ncbi:cell division protein ZapE [Magnetofaba australis]|uniref:Putative AFG1 family ATPase n=1 Tax=Magnetofaba australis IT-1 TaxID=1434232 RepID=A0A1Y2K296_9PROT|nr:cell division protein ZapE [Magnetofaba australis]OSM02123.1 putative AFG1 family ATPase [Magnetofaba australis IT-1]
MNMPILPASLTPYQRYHQALRGGSLHVDEAQLNALDALDHLSAALNIPAEKVIRRGLTVWKPLSGALAPRGLYLFGPVGRGKSMLMQMLFDSVQFREKRRVHFHPFMEELHGRMHDLKPPKGVDRVRFMASQIAEEARLLCFDEFYVTNIGDAILLGRLVESLMACGVTLCATSNWAPMDLFQGGVNRKQFLPFIRLIERELVPVDLDSGADWRRAHHEPTARAEGDPEQLFTLITGHAAAPANVTLRKMGTSALGAVDGVFWYDLHDICARAIGRAEYLSLCEQSRAVIVSGVTRIAADAADLAIRFITLVDLLYEHRIPTRIFSDIDLESVCPEGAAAFAFERSVSRLHELSRLPLPEAG